MQKTKKLKKNQTLEESIPTNWLEYINDDHLKLAIPVGPRFQADVPDWAAHPHKKNSHISDSESDTLKWLGTRFWPIKDRSSETNGVLIGKGRPDICMCNFPGSIECVKRHVCDKRMQLQFDLGTIFWKWKFNEMGEEVSKTWNQEEQKMFESLVKKNPTSKGGSFMKPALQTLKFQDRKTIVSYYFNVYLPKRMGKQIRSCCKIVDTDDEEGESPSSKGSRKRCAADSITLYSSKPVKARYLIGRR